MEQQVNNYHRFYASWRKMRHIDEAGEKEEVVSQWTNGRTTHLSEMRPLEYQNCCRSLESRLGYGDQRKRHRSICLHLMQQAGIDTTDWQRINDFCRHPRICGKPFAMLDIDELEALARKLRAIERRGGLRNEERRAAEAPTSTDKHHQQITIIEYGTEHSKPC